MKIDRIQSTLNNRKYISFGEGNMNNITPSVAILALQNPNAKINFENDLNRSKRADMVQNPNILTAFANKVSRAINEFKRSNNDKNIHPSVAGHINYAA